MRWQVAFRFGMAGLLWVGAARGGEVALVAGGGTGGDGSPAAEAKLVEPFAIDFDRDGTLLFVEMVGGERLRRVTAGGVVETLAGTGQKGFQAGDTPGAMAAFNGMHNLAVHRDGAIYLADTFNHAVRKYDPVTKSVTLFAGSGKLGSGPDKGPLDGAQFRQAICIAFDKDHKRLAVADIGNRRVVVIDLATNTFRVAAGNGQKGTPKDGEAAAGQPLTDPRAVCYDSKGTLYVLERGGHRLYAVSAEGRIRAVAGTGKSGRGGDGGPALQAALNGPKFIACDRDDSVLIVDTENHQLRRYTPGAETLTLVAGTGKAGGGGVGGEPSKLEMRRPHGVAVHPKTGDLFVADSENGRILRIPHP